MLTVAVLLFFQIGMTVVPLRIFGARTLIGDVRKVDQWRGDGSPSFDAADNSYSFALAFPAFPINDMKSIPIGGGHIILRWQFS